MKLFINESPVATISTDVDTFIIPDVPEENADDIIFFATKTDDVENCEWFPVDGDLGEIELTTDPVFFKLILLWAYRKKLTISDKRIGEIMRDNNIYESKRSRRTVRSLKEQDTKIEVKHEGILEVPEGKNVDDLPMSHFEKLVKKNGLSKITKALNNLQVWNKNDDKKLSKWAGDMIDKLTKKYGKNESLESDDIYIPENVKVLRNRLSDLGYSCGDPFSFFGKTVSSCVKFYPIGNDETGLEIEIDPYGGEYKATHYYYDSDDDYVDEDVSMFCDVRKVRTIRDIDNIDRWARETVRRNSL